MRCLFGIADGVLFKDLAYQVGGLAFLTRGERSLVMVNVFRRDHNVDGLGVVELLELLRGEFGLRRAAVPEDTHGLSLVLGQGLVDVIGDFGRLEFIAGLSQNSRNIKPHIAHADDCNLFC